MLKKLLMVETICTVVLLVLSVPALAQTHFSLSKAKSSISVSSGEDYEVYIGAGMYREEGDGTFGCWWLDH